MSETHPAEVTAIAVSFDHQLSEGRVLRFHTGISFDATPGQLDALLDRLTAATDRQAAKYEIKKIEKELAEHEKFYVMREEELVRVDEEAAARYARSNKREAFSIEKLTGKEHSDRQNIVIMRDRLREAIIERRAELSQLKGLVNGGTHGAADRSPGV